MDPQPTRTLDAIASVVAALARSPDALADIARDGALSEPMARRALARTCARYTPDALARCAAALDRDLADAPAVALLLGASVPTAPLRAIVLALLRGAALVRVRPPRRQPAFTARVVRALAAAGLPVALDPEPDGRAFVARAVAQGASVVIAYGADATLRAVADSLPAGVRFEGRGHGVGAAVVLADALAHDDPRVADAVAHDVADYDQFGCLSPQLVLVERDDARAFAAALAAALARLSTALPRGPIEPALAAQIVQWQGAVAVNAAAFHRGRDHGVAALAPGADPWVGSPGARNIVVVPAASRAPLRAALAPAAALLTCVGVAGAAPPEHDDDDDDDDARLLPRGCAARLVPVGTMQDPPLDAGYEDPRPPSR